MTVDSLRRNVRVVDVRAAMIEKEHAVRVILSGFVRVLLDVVFDCSAPIYWFKVTRGQRGPVLNNGTVFFVDAGAGPFAVTAKHVLDGYRTAVHEHPHTLCEIGGVSFDLLSNLIAEDRHTDIATLRIDGEILARIRRAPHNNPRAWPPRPPELGKGVFFGGYPGKHRFEEPRIIEWGFAGGLDIAATIHDDHVSIRFNRENWVVADSLPSPPELGAPWGGISGAPLFAVVQNGVVSWRLAGVVTDFQETYEILRASSLSRVCPDGSIS